MAISFENLNSDTTFLYEKAVSSCDWQLTDSKENIYFYV